MFYGEDVYPPFLFTLLLLMVWRKKEKIALGLIVTVYLSPLLLQSSGLTVRTFYLESQVWSRVTKLPPPRVCVYLSMFWPLGQ